MRKSTVLLAVFLMVFVIAIPSSADKLTLTGEYINSGVGSGLLEEEGFDNFLSPHSLSLNLGYIYKDTEFNVGITKFDLGYSPAIGGLARYKLGQSLYFGIESNNFEFSYLRGDYEKYNLDPSDDIIGFNFALPDEDYIYMPDGGFAELGNHKFIRLVNKNLFRASFSLGKLNVVGYYMDSELAEYDFNHLDPYSTYLTPSYMGTLGSFSGPAINANLNLSKYFNVGVTYSKIEIEDEDPEPNMWTETLSFNVNGKLPILSGEYFAIALKTSYPRLDGTDDIITTEKFTIFAGLKDVSLTDESKVRLGVDYIFADKNVSLYPDYKSALGQIGIYKTEMPWVYDFNNVHRVGISLGVNFSQNFKLNLNNGILFAKHDTTNNTDIIGNVTTLNLNYSDLKGNEFDLDIINDANFMFIALGNSRFRDSYNDLIIKALGKVKIGETLELGVTSKNNYNHVKYDQSTNEPDSNWFSGSANVFLISDMLFDLEKSNHVGVTLGGSVGVIYGNGYDVVLESLGDKWGRINYDVYAGINAKILEKLGLKFGVYAGTNTYIADAILVYQGSDTLSVDNFNWNDVNLVASTTIGYDVSEKTTLSLTGTYRNWKYMLAKDDDGITKVVNIAEEFDTVVNTKYFLQAKVTFKPTDTVSVSLALGNNGLAHEKATQSDKAMPWDYLKIPITTDFKDLWKHIELNVSINF